MASFYVVVQYVPRPTNDERINFGVFTYDTAGVHTRWLTDWRRVEAFGNGDITFLKEMAARFNADPWPIDLIKRAANEWANCIQLTKPRPSTLPAARLLEDIAPVMLVETAPVVS